MVLPFDAKDAPEASQVERVQGVFLSHVGSPSFTAVEQCVENGCLVDVHFGAFSQVFVFPRSLGQIGHNAGGFADSLGDLLVKAQIHGDSRTEVGEFVYYLESLVADFDFRGMADILGNHIGFFETDCGTKVPHALAILLMGLCNAASKCVARAASSAIAWSMSRTSTVLARG